MERIIYEAPKCEVIASGALPTILQFSQPGVADTKEKVDLEPIDSWEPDWHPQNTRVEESDHVK